MGLPENLSKLLELKGINSVDLAAKSGVPTSRISEIVTGKTKNPQLKTLQKIADALHVSVDVLTGSNQPSAEKGKQPGGLPAHAVNGTCHTVEIFNMVEGGNGAEPEWHEPVDRRSIPAGFLKAHIRPVLVRGRSMEPTFKNGAIIGIDQSDKQVIEGEAYAVVLPYSGAAVKRLYPQPDGVLIRSDNKEFPEVKLKKEDVPEYFILGRVCWVVQEV